MWGIPSLFFLVVGLFEANISLRAVTNLFSYGFNSNANDKECLLIL